MRSIRLAAIVTTRKLMFMIGRMAGLTAEVAEEYAREKPMCIRIPVEYDGEPPRQFEPET